MGLLVHKPLSKDCAVICVLGPLQILISHSVRCDVKQMHEAVKGQIVCPMLLYETMRSRVAAVLHNTLDEISAEVGTVVDHDLCSEAGHISMWGLTAWPQSTRSTGATHIEHLLIHKLPPSKSPIHCMLVTISSDKVQCAGVGFFRDAIEAL